MYDRDYILTVIGESAMEFFKQPECAFGDRFEEQVGKIFAAEEICHRIKESNKDPIRIVETFIKQMNVCYHADDKRLKKRWKAAMEGGMTILDILNALEN